jgi:predicted ATP-grasp superfamily ATP-dependent carboligase
MIKLSDVEIIPVVIPVSAHLDGPTLFGTARGLGRNGIPVHVIARGNYPIARTSRYIKTMINFPNDPPDEIWKETLITLSQKINKTQSKPIMIFCTENDLYRFAPMQNFLEQHFQLLPSFDETFKFLEKDKQLPIAEQAGFLVPKSKILVTKSDLELVIDTFNFPIIVKPLARHTVGIFEYKGLIVELRDKANEIIEKYIDEPPTVLIAQEYIKGTDNDVLFFMGSSDQNGDVRAFVTGRKLRQNPPSSGMMACGYIEQLPELEAKARALCKLYKINGFIGIECKRPPDTNDYFYIETSFRPEIFTELAEGAGVNLIYDVYAAKLGQTCTIKKTTDKGSWYDLFADYESIQSQVRQGKTTWRTLLKKLPRPITYSHFAFDDPLPFVVRLLEKIKTKIKSTLFTDKTRN